MPITPYSEDDFKEKNWIEECTSLICPYCKFEFSYEILCMGQGKDFSLKYCPVCGKRVHGKE